MVEVCGCGKDVAAQLGPLVCVWQWLTGGGLEGGGAQPEVQVCMHAQHSTHSTGPNSQHTAGLPPL